MSAPLALSEQPPHISVAVRDDDWIVLTFYEQGESVMTSTMNRPMADWLVRQIAIALGAQVERRASVATPPEAVPWLEALEKMKVDYPATFRAHFGEVLNG